MSMGHVTQRILNIRSVAVVAMGIYVNNHYKISSCCCYGYIRQQPLTQ